MCFACFPFLTPVGVIHFQCEQRPVFSTDWAALIRIVVQWWELWSNQDWEIIVCEFVSLLVRIWLHSWEQKEREIKDMHPLNQLPGSRYCFAFPVQRFFCVCVGFHCPWHGWTVVLIVLLHAGNTESSWKPLPPVVYTFFLQLEHHLSLCRSL